jgi:hypothetical protein
MTLVVNFSTGSRGVNNIGGKLPPVPMPLGGQFATGVNDTGGK